MTGQPETQQEPVRLVLGVCLPLLSLDIGLHLALFHRLPETIAVHRSVTGVVDNAGHRDLIWLGPMVHAFIIGLWWVSRRHTKASEKPLGAAVVVLASLYLFSLDLLGLLSNVDNARWQQATVAGRWMALALTLPALVYAAGLYAWIARRRRLRL